MPVVEIQDTQQSTSVAPDGVTCRCTSASDRSMCGESSRGFYASVNPRSAARHSTGAQLLMFHQLRPPGASVLAAAQRSRHAAMTRGIRAIVIQIEPTHYPHDTALDAQAA